MGIQFEDPTVGRGPCRARDYDDFQPEKCFHLIPKPSNISPLARLPDNIQKQLEDHIDNYAFVFDYTTSMKRTITTPFASRLITLPVEDAAIDRQLRLGVCGLLKAIVRSKLAIIEQ